MNGGLGVTTGGAQKREWKHKIFDYKFWHKINEGNKTCNTGTWKKKLQTIANDKAKADAGNIEVQARARYIIDKREINTRAIASPVKGVSFPPFEEDIIHHINEAIVLISNGSPLSYYDNPYVRTCINSLNTRHRPIYWLKLARLIRCIIGTTHQ